MIRTETNKEEMEMVMRETVEVLLFMATVLKNGNVSKDVVADAALHAAQKLEAVCPLKFESDEERVMFMLDN